MEQDGLPDAGDAIARPIWVVVPPLTADDIIQAITIYVANQDVHAGMGFGLIQKTVPGRDDGRLLDHWFPEIYLLFIVGFADDFDHPIAIHITGYSFMDACALVNEVRQPAAALSVGVLEDEDAGLVGGGRAERLDPNDVEAVGMLAVSLRRAARYRALERFLWRRLAGGPEPDRAGYERAFSELLKLYEGPLRRPETAEGLRRMREQS